MSRFTQQLEQVLKLLHHLCSDISIKTQLRRLQNDTILQRAKIKRRKLGEKSHRTHWRLLNSSFSETFNKIAKAHIAKNKTKGFCLLEMHFHFKIRILLFLYIYFIFYNFLLLIMFLLFISNLFNTLLVKY